VTASRVDVLIVGAGPSGLTAAATLSRCGVRFRIIDCESGPKQDSRATIVHSRTLELWDKLGYAQRAVSKGVRIDRTALMRDGRTFAVLPISGAESDIGTPFPYSLIFPQSQTEAMMVADLAERGQQVEWGTSFAGIEQSAEGVTVAVIHPDGSQDSLSASWMIACDGARSLVRERLGLQFEGRTHSQLAFVVDAELEAPDECRERVSLNYFREGYVGFVPMKSGSRRLFRVFGVVPDELEARMQAEWKEGVSPDDLTYIFRERLRTPVRVLSCRGTGLYRLHSRLIRHYRQGRSFLAGDAAHVHTPAGGQGMNTGIQDAHNIAWKLALVIKGIAKPEILDSYELERRAVAQAVIKGTDLAFAVEATKKPLLQVFNNYVMPLIVQFGSSFRGFRRIGARLFTQAWIQYRGSPIVGGDGTPASVRPGDRVADEHFDFHGPARSIFALLRGTEHQALVFEGARLGSERLAEMVRAASDLLAAYRLPVHTHLVPFDARNVHHRYGITGPTLVLVRPDGHVAYLGGLSGLDALDAYLTQWFIRR
jgi:2-polyprenyl-6-methoxyphenol hydroxylase-like FAD-dependent oxidoreductase